MRHPQLRTVDLRECGTCQHWKVLLPAEPCMSCAVPMEAMGSTHTEKGSHWEKRKTPRPG